MERGKRQSGDRQGEKERRIGDNEDTGAQANMSVPLLAHGFFIGSGSFSHVCRSGPSGRRADQWDRITREEGPPKKQHGEARRRRNCEERMG